MYTHPEPMTEPAATCDPRTLLGLRVLLTRPAHQARGTVALLQRRGAEAVSFPIIAIEPMLGEASVARAVEELAARCYDVAVFTSDNSVRCFLDAIGFANASVAVFDGVRVAAVGPATAAALHERGVVTDVVAETFIAESLAEAILALNPPPSRVLLPRALVAREILPVTLRRAGVTVDVVPVYRTVPASKERAAELACLLTSIDVVMLTSSSTVEHLCGLLGDDAARLLAGTVLASIGPITTGTAEKHGLSVAVTAEVSTTEGLADALERYVERRR